MTANWAFVPPARRVQVMACGNVLWNVVIDYLAHRSSKEEPPNESSASSQSTPAEGAGTLQRRQSRNAAATQG